MTCATPGGFIAQSSYSSIGYIAPAATGICLAKNSDQRVMVFAGDGGFQMSAQCLSTQTRFKLNPIIFVIDNGVYGVEQWLADSTVFHTDKPFYKSCILHPWNYSKLSEVFGCQGWKVATYGELKDAITRCIGKLKPAHPSFRLWCRISRFLVMRNGKDNRTVLGAGATLERSALLNAYPSHPLVSPVCCRELDARRLWRLCLAHQRRTEGSRSPGRRNASPLSCQLSASSLRSGEAGTESGIDADGRGGNLERPLETWRALAGCRGGRRYDLPPRRRDAYRTRQT